MPYARGNAKTRGTDGMEEVRRREPGPPCCAEAGVGTESVTSVPALPMQLQARNSPSAPETVVERSAPDNSPNVESSCWLKVLGVILIVIAVWWVLLRPVHCRASRVRFEYEVLTFDEGF